MCWSLVFAFWLGCGCLRWCSVDAVVYGPPVGRPIYIGGVVKAQTGKVAGSYVEELHVAFGVLAGDEVRCVVHVFIISTDRDTVSSVNLRNFCG